MSELMTDPWSAITIVGEKGLVMKLWSVTFKNVQRGNQKVNSTYIGYKDVKCCKLTLFWFALSTFSHVVKRNIDQLCHVRINQKHFPSGLAKQDQTQYWFSLGGKLENGPTAQRHAMTVTQGRGHGRLSALTNHTTSRLKIRNLTAQDLSP